MAYSLVVAGLDTQLFDRARKLSDKLLAPAGKLILAPISERGLYTQKYIGRLLDAAHEYTKSKNETEPVSTLLIYVDFEDQSTDELLRAFFPFALPLSLSPPDFSDAANKSQLNNVLNQFARDLTEAAIEIRGLSRIVSEFTNVANLTPLLLPLRNFRSEQLRSTLRRLYDELAHVDDAKKFITETIKAFLAQHPRVQAPDDDRHCFSDGVLYFRSPGKHRHGFFRNIAAANHSPECLLNARSRIGGHYSASFHYDCIVRRGSLSESYPNCHDVGCAPSKNTHVNIAPNDYIR